MAVIDMRDKGEVVETKYVTISRIEYDRLLEAERVLEAARAAGVDNWSGWWDTEMKEAYKEDEDNDGGVNEFLR